jgi:hypothetical protein
MDNATQTRGHDRSCVLRGEATHFDPLFTMRSETVAVGCHRLPIGLFEPFLGVSHLPPVATGYARWAP